MYTRPAAFLEILRRLSIVSILIMSSWLLFSFLVVCVVRVVVQVMFDSHEQARKPHAATQIGGEHNTWDQVICSGVR